MEKKEYPLVDECYDYLIKMPIYNLTKERIEELKKDRDMKMESFESLKGTSERDIYLGELKEWKKCMMNSRLGRRLKVKGGVVKSGKKKIIKKKK